MTDRELLAQCYDTMKVLYIPDLYLMRALKARLEQPEQKPMAWYYAGSDVEPNSVAFDADLDDAQKANCKPLYPAPSQREWVGLTDEEIFEAYHWERLRFARAIEAKLREKNA